MNESPLHRGRFDLRSSKALSAPVYIDLQIFPVQIHDGDIYIQLLYRYWSRKSRHPSDL